MRGQSKRKRGNKKTSMQATIRTSFGFDTSIVRDNPPLIFENAKTKLERHEWDEIVHKSKFTEFFKYA